MTIRLLTSMLLFLILLNNAYPFVVGIDSNITKVAPEFKSEITLLYKRIGIDIKLLELPSARSLSMLKSNEIDAEAIRIDSKIKNAIKINIPIATTFFSLYESKKPYSNKVVYGCTRGDIFCDKFAKIYHLNIHTYAREPKDLFKMMKYRRITHFLMPKLIFDFYNGHQFASQTDKSIKLSLFHYINVKNRRLKKKLEDELLKMKNEGFFNYKTLK